MNGGIALVTGASSGIGRVTAERLAANGWRTYGTSRHASAPDPPPGGVRMLVMDVTDDTSVRTAVAGLVTAEGRVDLLVNNAGYVLAGAVEDTSLVEARAQFETNFFGLLRVTKEVLPHMRRQRSGLIVNVSSLGGVVALPFQALYSATKFAVEGLSEALRQEVAPHGIRVVLVEPGDVRTSITANRVRAKLAGTGSAYEAAFTKALSIIEREERAGALPDAVARTVVRLTTAVAPPVRVSSGKLAQRSSLVAKRLLDSRVFEWIIMKYYGLR